MSGNVDPMESLLNKYGIDYPRCGAGVGDGWMPLVERLIVDLIALGWDRDCHQIKEKFGGLRFYVGEVSEECRARITAAEEESERTCEVCGSPGKLTGFGGWVTCRCGQHDLPDPKGQP